MANRVFYDNDAVDDSETRPGVGPFGFGAVSSPVVHAASRPVFEDEEAFCDSEHAGETSDGPLFETTPRVETWQENHAIEARSEAGRRHRWQWFIWTGTLVLGLGAGAGLGIGLSHARTMVAPPNRAVDVSADTGFKVVANDIIVDVKGDVKNPGLVHVAANARVKDVIDAAGGFLHQEDSVAVNLAALVDDGEELVVPDVVRDNAAVAGSRSSVEAGSTRPGPGQVASAAVAVDVGTQPNMKIDLNTADVATLQTIPGIGPSRASAILAFRQQYGRFQSVDALQKVKGIGPVTYQRIAQYVVVLPASNQSAIR